MPAKRERFPTLVRKNGKRYIKIKGKKGKNGHARFQMIKVHHSISERELIKWMIKHFHPRRKRGPKKETEQNSRFANKALKEFTPGTGFATHIADTANAEKKKAEDKLEAVQQNAGVLSKEIEEAKKELKLLTSEKRLLLKEAKDESKDEVEAKEDALKGKELEAHLSDLNNRIYTLKAAKAQSEKEIQENAKKIGEQQKHIDEQIKSIEEHLQIFESVKTDKAKSKRMLAEQMQLAKERQNLHAKLVTKAAEKVEADIAKLTIPKLREIAGGLTDTRFKADYGQREILLDELLKNKTIDREAMKMQVVHNDPEYPKLMEMDKHIASLETAMGEMLGDGRNVADEGMSDSEIVDVMKDHPEFLGVFASNEMYLLKPKMKALNCWIMNTEPRGEAGAHWVAFLVDTRPHGSHTVEYYNSLADPITSHWLADLQGIVKRVNPHDTYLRYKENAIADQNHTSANCGEFACHFLLVRLKGQSFGQASGWNERGERDIERWKRENGKMHEGLSKRWISGQVGDGLKDIFNYVRKGATRVLRRIKDTLGGPRVGPSPQVRGWLEKYGSREIESITVCKKPILSWIDRIGNWVTQGQLKENMDRLGYENMMHLYMIVRVRGGPTVKIEKNQVVEIKESTDIGKLHLTVGGGGTVQSRFDAATKIHGAKFWQYHLVTQNCQKFVLWFLGNPSEMVRKFVDQDVGATLKDMGLLQKIATGVTDLAATADVAMNGAGLHVGNHSVMTVGVY